MTTEPVVAAIRMMREEAAHRTGEVKLTWPNQSIEGGTVSMWVTEEELARLVAKARRGACDTEMVCVDDRGREVARHMVAFRAGQWVVERVAPGLLRGAGGEPRPKGCDTASHGPHEAQGGFNPHPTARIQRYSLVPCGLRWGEELVLDDDVREKLERRLGI